MIIVMMMMLKDIKRTLFYQYTCIYELRDLCLCALPYPSDGSNGMALSHERTVYIDVAMEKMSIPRTHTISSH